MAAVHFLTFPGAIYDADGNALDEARPHLAPADLDAFPHRSMVARHGTAPVAQVWLLADDATPAAIPPIFMVKAVRLILAGKGILVLAQRPEPEVDVRRRCCRPSICSPCRRT